MVIMYDVMNNKGSLDLISGSFPPPHVHLKIQNCDTISSRINIVEQFVDHILRIENSSELRERKIQSFLDDAYAKWDRLDSSLDKEEDTVIKTLRGLHSNKEEAE